MSGELGVLLVDKPRGPTSHDVVGWVRWALREKSVGHCGTLDPAATGLLVVCVGRATRLSNHLTREDKAYEAVFQLGVGTDTDDAEGQVTARADVEPGLKSRAAAVLLAMKGELQLPPPRYSAVHVDGRRAHTLARAGADMQLDDRPMAILELDMPEWDGVSDGLRATLRVSKGTYIRSIAVELGRRLGVPAHLGSLRRLACGELRVDCDDVVGPLRAEPFEPPGGKTKRGPRFRVRAPVSDDRESQGAWLRARLRPALDVWPGPRWQAGESETVSALMHGQAVPAGTDARPGWVAVTSPSGGLLVAEICAGDPAGDPPRDGLWVHPRRLISPLSLGPES